MSLTLNCVIVSLGLETPGGKHFMQQVEKGDLALKFLDARDFMKFDSTKACGRNRNAFFPVTQRNIIKQKGFVDVCTTLIDNIQLDYPHIVIVACSAGEHRSMVIGETCQQALNSAEHVDGSRVFNCLHINVSEHWGKDEYSPLYERALQWTLHPWCLIDGGAQSLQQMFGYKASTADPDAYKNFELICQHMVMSYPGVSGALAKKSGEDGQLLTRH